MALIATAGASNANSYLTVEEADAYFATRVALKPTPWGELDDSSETLLIMATRVLNALAQPFKTFVQGSGSGGSIPGYYRVRRQWTGLPATSTQRLAWPRVGMYDLNGNVIDSAVIPQDLKDATAELAGQLGAADRTLDNDVIVQGLKSIKAGSISLDFKDAIVAQVIPDMVYNLMPQSWLTDEVILPAYRAELEVL